MSTSGPQKTSTKYKEMYINLVKKTKGDERAGAAYNAEFQNLSPQQKIEFKEYAKRLQASTKLKNAKKKLENNTAQIQDCDTQMHALSNQISTLSCSKQMRFSDASNKYQKEITTTTVEQSTSTRKRIAK